MSAFNIKSVVLTGRDASPKVLQESALDRGSVKEGFGVQCVSNAGTDLNTAGTQIRLVTVPSVARISTMDYAGTSCGTSAIDLAVWYPTLVNKGGMATGTSGALISSSKFVTNITIPDTNQVFITAFPSIATMGLGVQEQPLWQMIGLTSDPGISLDIGFTVRTACAINGYVGLRVRYVE